MQTSWLCFIEDELWLIEVLHCGNVHFLPLERLLNRTATLTLLLTLTLTLIWWRFDTVVLCSCDLDFDPMTFIYELDPFSLEIHPVCKNELHMSRL